MTMDERGLFVAELLDASGGVVAAGAARRLHARHGDLAFGELLAEARSRVLHLAESVAAGVPALFADHVAWLRDGCAAREASSGLLADGLRALEEELAETLPPDAAALASVHVAAALQAAGCEPCGVGSPIEEECAFAALARRFLLALLEARREDALELVERAADGGADLADLEVEVVARVLEEVGAMWLRGELLVAEEHVASAIAVEALAALRRRIPRAPAGARTAVVASVGGNQHELGARIVADCFALAGWRPVFLGADTPPADVVWAAGEFGAAAVALSASIPLHVRPAAELVRLLRGAGRRTPVLVGGGPFRRVPDLWRAVGADGCAADARDVAALAEALASA